MSIPLTQHNEEIALNRAAWASKPLLREIYAEFHRLLAQRLAGDVPGLTVELGSGIGSIKETIPDCITTDLFPNPWLDRQENIYALSFASGSVANLILFDVWHHLRYPGTALRECQRVLAPGGRVLLFEPAISWLSHAVYGLLHHEPVAWRHSYAWDAPANFTSDQADYYAAQGNATRMFWHGEAQTRLEGWELIEATPLVNFRYFATGGFSKPTIGGPALHAWLSRLENFSATFPQVFASRLIVVLQKSTLIS